MQIKSFVILLLLATMIQACGNTRLRPDDVTVAAGEACHLGGGWLNTGDDAVCLSDLQALKLKPQPEGASAPEPADKPFDERFDCYGIFNNACNERGVAYTKVKLGEPCGDDAMCLEGACVVSVRADKMRVWTCTK